MLSSSDIISGYPVVISTVLVSMVSSGSLVTTSSIVVILPSEFRIVCSPDDV